MKIIYNHLYIKFWQFTQDELDVVQSKIKNRKAAGFDEKLPNREIRRPAALIQQRCI